MTSSKDFIQFPRQAGTSILRIDNLPYEQYILNDYTRVAAVLLLCNGHMQGFSSTDDTFEHYLQLANSISIRDYFLQNFEEIMLMYVYARFGNLFRVVLERVPETSVSYPIGVFLKNNIVCITYSPLQLTEVVNNIALTIFLYGGRSRFLQSTATANEQGGDVDDDDDKDGHGGGGGGGGDNNGDRPRSNLLGVPRPLNSDRFEASIHSTMQAGSFLSGVNNHSVDMACYRRERVIKRPTFEPLFSAPYNTCPNNDDPSGGGDGSDGRRTTTYLNAQKMMLAFNIIYNESNKVPLLDLACLRVLLATAVRPIIDALHVATENSTAQKQRKQKFSVRSQPAAVRTGKITQIAHIIQKQNRDEMHTYNVLCTGLLRQRLNIEVAVNGQVR